MAFSPFSVFGPRIHSWINTINDFMYPPQPENRPAPAHQVQHIAPAPPVPQIVPAPTPPVPQIAPAPPRRPIPQNAPVSTQDDAGVDCDVCLEPFDLQEDAPHVLKCAHHAHKRCLLDMLARGQPCHTCRVKFTKEEILPSPGMTEALQKLFAQKNKQRDAADELAKLRKQVANLQEQNQRYTLIPTPNSRLEGSSIPQSQQAISSMSAVPPNNLSQLGAGYPINFSNRTMHYGAGSPFAASSMSSSFQISSKGDSKDNGVSSVQEDSRPSITPNVLAPHRVSENQPQGEELSADIRAALKRYFRHRQFDYQQPEPIPAPSVHSQNAAASPAQPKQAASPRKETKAKQEAADSKDNGVSSVQEDSRPSITPNVLAPHRVSENQPQVEGPIAASARASIPPSIPHDEVIPAAILRNAPNRQFLDQHQPEPKPAPSIHSQYAAARPAQPKQAANPRKMTKAEQEAADRARAYRNNPVMKHKWASSARNRADDRK